MTNRIESGWKHLRLIVEERPEEESYVAYVHDPDGCDVLYAARCISQEEAKVAAVDFAVAQPCRTDQDLNPEAVFQILLWAAV